MRIIQLNGHARSRVNKRKLPRIVSSWVLSTPKDGDCTTSLSNLFQYSSIFTVKKIKMDQDPQDLFCKSCFLPGQRQCSLVPDDIAPQRQDFAFPFAKFCKIPVCPYLQPVKVPLNTSTPIWYISLFSSFVVICKLVTATVCPHHPDHY